MRIIAGTLRGRSIAAPPGRGTRPMLDRVREAMFSTLAPWLEGARVLDLFAGSGSLGLEALSRGATHATFVEQGARVVPLLRGNVEELGVAGRATVVMDDALASRSWYAPAGFDIVFLDPPYPLLREAVPRRILLTALAEIVGGHLAPEGVVVLHTPRQAVDRRQLPPGLRAAERVYGTNALWFLQGPGEEEGEGEESGGG